MNPLNIPAATRQLERSERGQMGCKLLRDFLKSNTVNFMDQKNMEAIAFLAHLFLMGKSGDSYRVIKALDDVIERNQWVNQPTSHGETSAAVANRALQPEAGLQLKLHAPTPPAGLLPALARASLNYSTAKTLFHLVWLGDDHYCGVFGDGDNGAYEWFIWQGGKLEHSNAGYGGTDCALRDALQKSVPA